MQVRWAACPLSHETRGAAWQLSLSLQGKRRLHTHPPIVFAVTLGIGDNHKSASVMRPTDVCADILTIVL